MIGIICDKDGTLIDSERRHLGAWVETGRLFGIRFEAVDLVDLPCRPKAEVDAYLTTLIVERAGEAERTLGSDDAKAVLAEMRARKNEIVRAHTQILGRPGLHTFLAAITELREKGFEIRLAVATSDRTDAAISHLRQLGILEHFQVVVGADMVADPKPAPDVYVKALEELSLQPERCLAIEDTIPGLIAARRAGLRVLVIPDTTPVNRFQGEHKPTYLCTSLREAIPYIKNQMR